MTGIRNGRALPGAPLAGAGAAVFVLAYAWLLLNGETEIAKSADPGAAGSSLWAVALPPLAAILLARAVPPKDEPPLPLAESPRDRLRKETGALLASAIVVACLLPFSGDAYPLVKVVVLLLAPLIAFKIIRGGGGKARVIPAPAAWVAPLPAVAAWFVLSQVWPFAVPLTQELPDPITLVVASLITLLTASVLEEVFYRAWLQTRLEALYGRWPAIMVSSLLFALMHSDRLDAAAPLTGLAAIVAAQGLFGLMLGYLWSRYRNIWVIIFIHVTTNLILVPMLVERL
ncbi:CPBP family intramembrane glutamic endopeptidase [Spirillospora sp. NPDC029432]|uniref:CPBP family intramembrane glutamic endopeptidase n=1 Tax=Spirillospora sp. NPDC029432 TaxID=3154599 RepID=UPI003456A896